MTGPRLCATAQGSEDPKLVRATGPVSATPEPLMPLRKLLGKCCVPVTVHCGGRWAIVEEGGNVGEFKGALLGSE